MLLSFLYQGQPKQLLYFLEAEQPLLELDKNQHSLPELVL